MKMTREERSKFVEGYSKVLTQAWADDAFRSRLQANPRDVLQQEGISVPSNVKVNLIEQVQQEGSLEDQIRIWAEGLEKGEVDLYVPATPQLADGELSETQLEAVAGGGDCCCCCTPCCPSP
jgi:hypothetical protein